MEYIPIYNSYYEDNDDVFNINWKQVLNQMNMNSYSAKHQRNKHNKKVKHEYVLEEKCKCGHKQKIKYICKCPPGPIGPQGEQGVAGPQGPSGINGTQGPQGPRGPRGYMGLQGPRGSQGIMGPPGPSGSKGTRGPRGLQGPQGPQGPQGERGHTGATGPKGTRGPRGLQGPQGPQGPQGERGHTGVTGPKGPQGQPGIAGERGPRGFKGCRGPRGPAGKVLLEAYGYIYNINEQKIDEGEAVRFNKNLEVKGISFTPGSSQVIIDCDGVYYIEYYAYPQCKTQFEIYVNDKPLLPLTDFPSRYGQQPGNKQNFGHVITRFKNGDVITLRLIKSSGNRVTLRSDPGESGSPAVNAAIILFKLGD